MDSNEEEEGKWGPQSTSSCCQMGFHNDTFERAMESDLRIVDLWPLKCCTITIICALAGNTPQIHRVVVVDIVVAVRGWFLWIRSICLFGSLNSS